VTKMMNNDYLLRKNRILQNNGTSTATSGTAANVRAGQPSFEEVLSKVGESQELKFSKHALERLESRNIQLTPQEIAKISDAVDKAGAKGVKDALILMNDKVFIASVRSKTIVTAATEDQLKNNVFTQIDGAVIV